MIAALTGGEAAGTDVFDGAAENRIVLAEHAEERLLPLAELFPCRAVRRHRGIGFGDRHQPWKGARTGVVAFDNE